MEKYSSGNKSSINLLCTTISTTWSSPIQAFKKNHKEEGKQLEFSGFFFSSLVVQDIDKLV